VVWDKILFEAKAVEKLTDSHIKQVLNYLAASKLRLGLLVNFGGDSLEWKKVIFMRHETLSVNSCNSCLSDLRIDFRSDLRQTWLR